MYQFVPSILRLNYNGLYRKANSIQTKYLIARKIKEYCLLSRCAYATESATDQHEILTNAQLESITKGDANLLQKLNVLMLEVQVLRQDGDRVPDHTGVKEEQWEQLLSLPTRSARKRYLKFLWQLEKKHENEKIKKELTRKAREEFINSRPKDEDDTDFSSYRLFGNTIFLRVYDTTVNQYYNNRLIQAMRFGQPLVLDCSYSEHMSHRERLNTAKQLMLLFAANRQHDSPFDLHYCNCDPKDTTMKELNKFITTLHESWFPLNIHEGSYLDHFPKERLVYLTPHCRNDLEEFNHDDIYIIGAMVDKSNSEPLSLGKAKQQGLRMARLPLDRYLAWSKSSKSLTLNQVCTILLDIKNTGDWDKSLVHVPRRKVMSDEELSQWKGSRNEKKSLFINNRFKGYKREDTFERNFKNLDGYENFTDDTKPVRRNYEKSNKNFQTDRFNNVSHRPYQERNRLKRPSLKEILEED